MNKIIVLLLVCGIVLAGPRFGGNIGYYAGDDPRTGTSAGGPVFGGQFVMPFMSLIDFEISAGYTSSKSTITMESYLYNYIEEETGENFEGNLDSLLNYVENQWGWENPTVEEMTGSYESTFHDLCLAATLKVNIPISMFPLKPYVGGGGGAHFQISDADALIAFIEEQSGSSSGIDIYDHVLPEIHGCVGVTFKPPVAPISVFGEYRYSKPLGDTAGDPISMYYTGVNLGF